jgi:hypothetical protein
MRRLTIVRHLFQIGVDQSHKGEPLSGLAILPLHDATELFLQVALEHKEGALPARSDFMAYWPALSERGAELNHREGMKRFNRARVSLKHDGTIPAHDHIEDFRLMVGDFLETNCQTIFAIRFADISLSGLVRDVAVRDHLEKAELALGDCDYSGAMEHVALAFHYLTTGYIYGELTGSTHSRLFHPLSAKPVMFNSEIEQLGDAGRTIVKSIDSLRDDFGEAITMIAYNLDFDGYRYLKTYCPFVRVYSSGRVAIDWVRRSRDIDARISRRCVAFVIDAALRLEGGKDG